MGNVSKRKRLLRLPGGRWSSFWYGSIVFLGLLLFLWLTAYLFAPPASDVSPAYTDDMASRHQEKRQTAIVRRGETPFREVNYGEADATGAAPSWFPRRQAPILQQLVEEGELPPLAERVGPEPLVLEGPEGNGKYGGTLIQVEESPSVALDKLGWSLSGATLARWSPSGYPIVPHVAKSWEISEDARTFTLHLRKGMNWSDGHPFTAEDILYYYEYEAEHPAFKPDGGAILLRNGATLGTVEQVDDHTVRFRFEEPKGSFLEELAGWAGLPWTNTPAHYLKTFHPEFGDQEKIRKWMEKLNLPTAYSLYQRLKGYDNPEHPRLWPWVLKTYKSGPPYTFVRNPYYFAVDSEGRQLPYIDRIWMNVMNRQMIPTAITEGAIDVQWSFGEEQYSLLMSNREKRAYRILHWASDATNVLMINFNINKKVNRNQPETERKRTLLQDRRFRQALSLSLDRREFTSYHEGWDLKIGQAYPNPESIYFEPAAFHAYTQENLPEANRLLDELGLTGRDAEGMRTFADGSRMTFFIETSMDLGGKGVLLQDQWARVGIRIVYRESFGRILRMKMNTLEHDMVISNPAGNLSGITDPFNLVPTHQYANWAVGYGRWYKKGGFFGDPRAEVFKDLEVPRGGPVYQNLVLANELQHTLKQEERIRIYRNMQRIAAREVWTMGLHTALPNFVMARDTVRNVPERALYSGQLLSPSNIGLETLFLQEDSDTEEVKAFTAKEIAGTVPLTSGEYSGQNGWGNVLTGFLRWIMASCFLAIFLMVALRHPFIAKRLLIMVPTLLIVTIIAFLIIQLPPGDYLTAKIAELEMSGGGGDKQRIEELKEQFLLDEPMAVRYAHWLGLKWFISFEDQDRGLLQGNLGRSMETGASINTLIGDRLLLTLGISLGSIMFTWIIAIPIGIYSAARQYSLADYLATIIGFVGMAVPNFLLAILLMYWSSKYFDLQITGLFSPRFAVQPGWSFAKFIDLLKHIWIPVVIMGITGTAGMIRVMRGNLLDELKKPYVVTARAKGMRPVRLLLKYPVRLALNPFISGIGGIFPNLISGGAIVAIILSLPTIGPLLVDALLTEDLYLAGSLLLILNFLGIFGILVSDLLLLLLDPRIRYD